MVLQRACYLSINPQKDETLETEKAQYYLPDGSTIEVGAVLLPFPSDLSEPWARQSAVEQHMWPRVLQRSRGEEVPGECPR